MEFWFSTVDLYCERLSSNFLAEPLNLFSNLSFIIAGLWALKTSRNSAQDCFAATSIFKALSLIAISVGIGSALFHSLATRWAQALDVIPIGIFLFLYLFSVLKYGMNFGPKNTVVGLGLFLIVSAALATLVPAEAVNGSQSYFGTFIALFFLSKLAIHQGIKGHVELMLASITFLLALSFRTIDNMLCPTISFGTHFIWHLLNGLVIFLCLRAASSWPNVPPAPK